MEAQFKNGVIHYKDDGPKNSPTLVFIHAFPLHLEMWENQVEYLSHQYRIITYDIRGHGKSIFEEVAYTLEFFVEDLIQLLDHLNLSQTALCGLSMGAYIALRAFEKYPDRFNALILCDTRSEADSNDTKLKRSATLKNLQEKGIKFFADEFIKSIFISETFQTNPSLIQKTKKMILENSSLGIARSLLALISRTDTTESLAKIKVPTLLLVGKQDQLTPPSAAYLIKEQIPHAEMHVIPHAGHLSNLENPSEFNQKLLAFLKKEVCPQTREIP